MFRFFYTVKEDYRQIKEAMYLQELVTSQFFCQPLRMIEYRFVPLLMCLSRTADDAATSATSIRMSVGQERSSISKSRLRLLDYFWMFAMLAIVKMMLKLNDFSLTYDQPFLDDINLSFKPGEITVLTGEFRLRKE